MLGLILCLIAGVLMSFQSIFNTRIAEVSNVWVSNTYVHGSGMVVCLIIWLITGRHSFTQILNVDNKIYLLAGALGVAIIFSVVKGISALGPSYAVMLFLTTQLITSYCIEVFGLFGTDKVDFDMKKLLGIVVMILGIILFKWDK